NLRTDSDVTPFIAAVDVADARSQLQLTYLVNEKRARVLPDNVLNLRGAGAGSLDVAMIERTAAGTSDELTALDVRGGELVMHPAAGSVRRFLLNARPGASIALVPSVSSQASLTIDGVSRPSGA